MTFLIFRLKMEKQSEPSYLDPETNQHQTELGTFVKRKGRFRRFVPTSGFCNELKETWRLSWVLIVIQLFVFSMQPITTMFGGHVGKLELDALALANSMINIVGWSTLSGFSSVCDTYFSQSFGAKNDKLIGVYLQRCLILHGFLLCVLFAMCLNIGHILLWFGQEPVIVDLTSQYMFIFSPSLIAMTFYIVFRQFIYTQNIILPDLFISASALVLHVVIQYLNFTHTSFGLDGSAFGQVIVNFYLLFATLFYVVYSGMLKKTWPGWGKAALNNWADAAKLGTYGALLVCFEWWAFEASIILAGLLGATQLAAQSIVTSLDFVLYSFVGGYGSATSIRVGWFLGENRPDCAITSCSAGMTLVTITSTIISAILIIFYRKIPHLFTDDAEILHLTSNLLLILALYTFLDGFSCVARGCIRGAGMQKIGTIVVAVTYYLIGIPLGIPLMFLTYLELYGIWIGYLTITTIGSIVYIFIVYYGLNWDKLAAQTQTRSQKELHTLKREENKKLIGSAPTLYGSIDSKDSATSTTTSDDSGDSMTDIKMTTCDLVIKFTISITFITIFLVGIIVRVFYPLRI